MKYSSRTNHHLPTTFFLKKKHHVALINILINIVKSQKQHKQDSELTFPSRFFSLKLKLRLNSEPILTALERFRVSDHAVEIKKMKMKSWVEQHPSGPRSFFCKCRQRLHSSNPSPPVIYRSLNLSLSLSLRWRAFFLGSKRVPRPEPVPKPEEAKETLETRAVVNNLKSP